METKGNNNTKTSVQSSFVWRTCRRMDDDNVPSFRRTKKTEGKGDIGSMAKSVKMEKEIIRRTMSLGTQGISERVWKKEDDNLQGMHEREGYQKEGKEKEGVGGTLWLVLNRTCNLSCSYCYQGDHSWAGKGWQEKAGLIKSMPDEVFEKALPWALKWSRDSFKINCYGGEPLLAFDKIQKWVPIWDEAFHKAGKNLNWGVTTNGTMLNKEVRDFIEEYEFGILLSLDGPARTHNQTRVFYGNKPSWDSIPVDEILGWRPNIEIAWQLDPGIDFNEDDLAWMINKGFSRVNFNINWLKDWEPKDQIRLQQFFRTVGRLTIQTARDGKITPWEGCSNELKKTAGKKLLSNFFGKFNDALIKTGMMKQPCGTGLAMLALTPEGFLYPSQEMAFMAFEPGRAPGTDAYYRVGNVHNDPVIDTERLSVVSTIQTSDMKTPEGYNCNNCINKPISIGGSCHCRAIGLDGEHAGDRYYVYPGYCASQQSVQTGMLQAAMIEKYIGFKSSQPAKSENRVQGKGNGRLDISHLDQKLDKVLNKLDHIEEVSNQT